ncbi:MAG: hypothetical protein LBV68_02710 [Spirochaetaceae bacterium]|jgi:hypothetical protein|nr:hypothetical protein [Spirochaetaceae bacterium]
MKRKTRILALVSGLMVVAAVMFIGCTVDVHDNPTAVNQDKGDAIPDDKEQDDKTSDFVPVSSITGVPHYGFGKTSLPLNGVKVEPANATNKTIKWEIVSNNGIGKVEPNGTVSFPDNRVGVVTIKAIVVNGATTETDWTGTFNVTVDEVPFSVIDGYNNATHEFILGGPIGSQAEYQQYYLRLAGKYELLENTYIAEKNLAEQDITNPGIKDELAQAQREWAVYTEALKKAEDYAEVQEPKWIPPATSLWSPPVVN